jgi:hypothetical protein
VFVVCVRTFARRWLKQNLAVLPKMARQKVAAAATKADAEKMED